VSSPGQPQGPTGTTTPSPTEANTSTSSLQVFRDIGRTLTEEDLKSPGVVRLIVDRLELALARCAQLEAFEQRFHDVDKQLSIANEKQKKNVALDIAWAGGLAVGAMCIGLVPGLWEAKPGWIGPILLVVGIAFIGLGLVIRAVVR
jgi:hypothetical protein